MPWYKWSQTASANATADGTINWAEGQAPSSVNDSARAMMAATAMYRDDIAGATVTTGTSTAYNLSTFSGFDTLAHLSGQIVAFTPNVTNAQTVTLNVDSLGAKPLRSSPGIELPAGTVIQGTPYVAIYNNGDGVFYLQGFYGSPYNIPLAGGLDYWASTAPNSSFAFPIGQAISRATYATIFSLIGTAYGTGDGTTTFNLPDKRGRVSAALDPTGGIVNSSTMSPNGNSLGALGGAQIANAPLPAHSHDTTELPHAHSVNMVPNTGTASAPAVGGSGSVSTSGTSGAKTNLTVNSAGSGNGDHPNMQPTIMCNYIMRII